MFNNRETPEEREERIRREEREFRAKENRRNQKELAQIFFAGTRRGLDSWKTRDTQPKGGEKPARSTLKRDQCAYCKELGHWKNECPKRNLKKKRTVKCQRRNETPTLQSGLNLYILTLAFYSCFILYPLYNNLQGKLPSTMIQRLYSAQAQGEITFTLAYLLQLRLCFGELPYQLRIHFVPGSVPFEESEKHPCVQAMFFSHGNKQDS